MFYLLHGTDVHKSRKKLHEMLGVLSKKRPNSEVFRLTTENWSESQFDELTSSQGLFDSKYIVVLDGILERKEIKNYFLERLGSVKDSDKLVFFGVCMTVQKMLWFLRTKASSARSYIPQRKRAYHCLLPIQDAPKNNFLFLYVPEFRPAQQYT
jgi:hypothetical protein